MKHLPTALLLSLVLVFFAPLGAFAKERSGIAPEHEATLERLDKLRGNKAEIHHALDSLPLGRAKREALKSDFHAARNDPGRHREVVRKVRDALSQHASYGTTLGPQEEQVLEKLQAARGNLPAIKAIIEGIDLSPATKDMLKAAFASAKDNPDAAIAKAKEEMLKFKAAHPNTDEVLAELEAMRANMPAISDIIANLPITDEQKAELKAELAAAKTTPEFEAALEKVKAALGT